MNSMLVTTLRRLALGVPVAVAFGWANSAVNAAEELNALVWCDHTDPALIQPFEEMHGVKVNLKEYEGTGAALAIVEQSRPGDWDVFVVDGVDVPGVVASGLLAELPQDEILARVMFQKPSGSLSGFQALQLAQAAAQFSGDGDSAYQKMLSSLGVVPSASGDDGPMSKISRALGDRDFKVYASSDSDLPWKESLVTAEPEVRVTRVQEGDELILACDGLWDVLSVEAAFEYLHGKKVRAERAEPEPEPPHPSPRSNH